MAGNFWKKYNMRKQERVRMNGDRDKRKLRKLKRDLKRAGSKHRRRDLKRQLAQEPDQAHHDAENLGRYRSVGLNGLDRDATRRRDLTEEEE
jgi:hypothetical protein